MASPRAGGGDIASIVNVNDDDSDNNASNGNGDGDGNGDGNGEGDSNGGGRYDKPDGGAADDVTRAGGNKDGKQQE